MKTAGSEAITALMESMAELAMDKPCKKQTHGLLY